MANESIVLDNSGERPLHVPGINGCPIEFESDLWADQRFGHGANDWRQSCRLTVREAAMLQVMDSLTDKPDWTRKVNDEKIVEKWRAEALQMPRMSDKAFDWCIRELQDEARLFEEKKYVHTLNTGSRCVKSDALVDESLRQEFVKLTEPLLKAEPKDWHPNSKDQVLDLVHPSLYPLVFGRTAVMQTGQVDLLKSLQYSGKGEIVQKEEAHVEEEDEGDAADYMAAYRRQEARRNSERRAPLFSKRFQWLPCEVKFLGDSGSNVEITSYINNLHPNKNRQLYKAIEKLISLSIDPWSEVLVKARDRTPLRITTFGAEFDHDMPEWIQRLPFDVDGHEPDVYKKYVDDIKAYLEQPDDGESDPDDEQESWVSEFPDGEDWKGEMGLCGVAEWKYKRLRKILHPEPGVSYSYDDWKQGKGSNPVAGGDPGYINFEPYSVNIAEQFRDRGLQVIVKLASIELTSDKPDYAGGSWHVEGMLNEHIVATSIYYYDVNNTTESRIRFRMEADLDSMSMSYEQDEHEPLAEIFGTDGLRDGEAVQEIGHVATKQGRLLAFPNSLQHCVQPFSLEDKTKPGHRRFIVLWLVDPHYRIVSTANVPPQQYEWCAEKQLELSQVGDRLPRELADMVFEDVVKNLMKLDEAKEHRLELMKERTSQAETIERGFDSYNFCEH